MSEEPGTRGWGLTIDAVQAGSVYTVALTGDLDLPACEEVERALRTAEASDAERILLDLDGLVFVDSSGLQALLRAKRRADGDGGRLKMTRGTGEVRELFKLTALDMVLPFADQDGEADDAGDRADAP